MSIQQNWHQKNLSCLWGRGRMRCPLLPPGRRTSATARPPQLGRGKPPGSAASNLGRRSCTVSKKHAMVGVDPRNGETWADANENKAAAGGCAELWLGESGELRNLPSVKVIVESGRTAKNSNKFLVRVSRAGYLALFIRARHKRSSSSNPACHSYILISHVTYLYYTVYTSRYSSIYEQYHLQRDRKRMETDRKEHLDKYSSILPLYYIQKSWAQRNHRIKPTPCQFSTHRDHDNFILFDQNGLARYLETACNLIVPRL